MSESTAGTLTVNKISEWFQIVASLGVFLGLILVAYELMRNEAIGLGSLAMEGVQDLANAELVLAGENPAQKLAKACLDPKSLSDTDYVVLSAIFTYRATDVMKMETLRRISRFDMTASTDFMFARTAMQIASSPAGRAWLETYMNRLGGMQPYARSELENPSWDCNEDAPSFIALAKTMSEESVIQSVT